MSGRNNRFWGGSDSDDSSSSAYSTSEYSEDEAPKKPITKSKYVIESESDSEEEKRVVKAPKFVLFQMVYSLGRDIWMS
jgi:hypothetical protein